MEIDYEQRNKDLKELIAMPLSDKIQNTMGKLMEFYDYTEGNCYISCSGGADSIVLYDLTKRFIEDLFPHYKFKVVFDDTGLEEPTVRATALAIPDIQVVKPKKSFWQVLTEIGYPVVSKEVSECVHNARLHLSGGGMQHTSERYVDLANMPQRVQKILGILPKKDMWTWRICHREFKKF